MPDREKVIKGLECHADRTNLSCRPSKCPYFAFDFCGPLLATDALALLKEQEAEISKISNAYLDLVGKASKQPEIVRCNDCKHYDGDENSRLGTCLENGVCSTPDWFCADGELKSEDPLG